MTTKKWTCLSTVPDYNSLITRNYYPRNRSSHTCVQYPENSSMVYMCGGNGGDDGLFKDVWQFDIDTLQWKNLFEMPQGICHHSTAVTPSGKMCCYGGQIDDDTAINGGRTNDIVGVWLKIPKLKIIAWEAMIHYFRDQLLASNDDYLKQIGVPEQFYKRIIDARSINVLENM